MVKAKCTGCVVALPPNADGFLGAQLRSFRGTISAFASAKRPASSNLRNILRQRIQHTIKRVEHVRQRDASKDESRDIAAAQVDNPRGNKTERTSSIAL